MVLRQHLDDRRRAGETRARADEDLDGARGDEPVDELLREPAGDLPRPVGRALAAVAPRVVDVRVEPVLVRRVARRAEAFAELAALRAREVADPDPRRLGVRRPVRGRHVEEGRDEAPGAGAPPVAIGGDPADRVPREERVALGGEGDARDEAAVPRQSDRARLGRGRRGGRGTAGDGKEGRGEQGEPGGSHGASCSRDPTMRTCVRAAVAGDPPCRRRRVLRVRRAAGRSEPPRPSGRRGRRGRAGGELRGAPLRDPRCDGRGAGPAALPAPRRRPTAVRGVRRGEQGALPRLRRPCPERRGDLARGGVPRRHRARAGHRDAAADRSAAPARRARARRALRDGRRREHEAAREDGERHREAGRARRPGAGRGARVPAASPGRAHLGDRPGDDPAAERVWAPHRRRSRRRRRARPRRHARAGGGAVRPRRRLEPRPATRGAAAAPRLVRVAVRGPALARRRRRRAARARRPRRLPDADVEQARADGLPAAPLRRLLARDAVAHPAPADVPRPARSSRRPGSSSQRRGRSSSSAA